MTAQRSRAEVDRLYKIAVDTRRRMYGIMPGCGCSEYWPEGPELDAMRALDAAIMEYNRPITLERTFNALRDAVTRAEAEIEKYHQSTTEEKS